MSEQIVENWDGLINAHPNSNIYSLLLVHGDENERITRDISSIAKQTDLDTATGKELENLGDFVGVNRKAGESDEKLRFRIKAEYIVQASDTTYRHFVTGISSILETEPSEIDVLTPPETVAKVIELRVDGAVLDSVPLSDNELSNLFSKMISIDARIDILRRGTFAFAGDGDDDNLAGFNEGTWSAYIN